MRAHTRACTPTHTRGHYLSPPLLPSLPLFRGPVLSRPLFQTAAASIKQLRAESCRSDSKRRGEILFKKITAADYCWCVTVPAPSLSHGYSSVSEDVGQRHESDAEVCFQCWKTPLKWAHEINGTSEEIQGEHRFLESTALRIISKNWVQLLIESIHIWIKPNRRRIWS